MFDIHVFGSGSSGNCIYVDTGDTKILLDAGLSLKDTKKGLRGANARLSDIDCILITHTHGDHIGGLRSIVSKYETPIITSFGESFDNKMKEINPSNFRIVKHRQKIKIGDCTITAYNSIHDTNEPLYFSIENSVGEKLLYLTDCGSDEGINVDEHDVYIIEANYYLDGILDSLKKDVIKVFQYNRTTSGTGHLELNQTIRILKDSIGDSTKHIILSHLSSSNANGQLFKDKVSESLNFENIDIATQGLNVKVGIDTSIF